MDASLMDAPLWILESCSHDLGMGGTDALKISRMVVELPFSATLALVDRLGKFREGVVGQVMNIIRLLMGKDKTSLPGTIVLFEYLERLPIVKNQEDCDILLVMFLKHYKGSTETVVSVFGDSLDDVPDHFLASLFDATFTNKLFKETPFVMKIPMKLSQTRTNIAFLVQGVETTELDEEEVAAVRTRIHT